MAVTRMRFTGSGAGTHYIDLARSISLQERKLHRQKKIYTVYGGFFVDTPSSGTSRVNINTAPNTWVTRRAVNRGFRLWKRMIAETIENSDGGIQSGRWNDFKVYLNGAATAGLLPVDAAGNNLYASAAEWDISTLTTDDPGFDSSGAPLPADQFELMIVGTKTGAVHDGSNPAGWTRVGLVDSWLNSRPTPEGAGVPDNSPDGPADPLSNLFDSGDTDDDRITIIELEGDAAPYDESAMFGMVSGTNSGDHNLQRQSVVTTTAQQPTGPVHGFQALCGLMQVEVTAAEGAWELVLDVETVGESF